MSFVAVNISVNTTPVRNALGHFTGRALGEALRRGLAAAGWIAAAEAQVEYAAKKLRQVTGSLANSIVASPESDIRNLTTYVGVPAASPAAKYAYLLAAGVKTIVPIRAKALTIPIAENLTGAGDSKFPTVAALKQAFGAAVVRRGGVIGVQLPSGTFEAYFALKRQVTVKGRDVLQPAAERSREEMRATIQREVEAAYPEHFGGGKDGGK